MFQIFNILSISELTKKGYQAIFNDKKCPIKNKFGDIRMTSSLLSNGIYEFNSLNSESKFCDFVTIDVCHKTMDHLNNLSLIKLKKGAASLMEQ